MIAKIIRTGLRPVRENMILWATDRLREVDRNIYAVKCRVADLELEVRGKFYEFDRDLNRDIPDHILIDRLRRVMNRYDQETFDRHRDGTYYYDDDDDYYDYSSKSTISREISRGISRGIEDAFAGLGERVSEFVKKQEKEQTPAPPAAPPAAPPPPSAPAATQQDVTALQQQLAALQAQLADLQNKDATDTSGTGGTA